MDVKQIFPASLLSILAASAGAAADWPGWMGPGRDGVTGERVPEIGRLEEQWRVEVGIGNAGVAVSGGCALTLGHDGEGSETLFCFDAETGAEKWHHRYRAKLMPNLHTGGPNATPLVDRGRVYSLSKDGQVFCLELDDGDVVWRRELAEALDTKVPTWGFASSPVLAGGQLLFTAGRTIALDPMNGETLWRSESQYKHGYSAVAIAGNNETPLLVAVDGAGLSVLNPADGTELARHPLTAKFNTVATTPLLLNDAGNALFVATNTGSLRLEFSVSELAVTWRTKDFQNNFSNSLLIGGFLYGIDGKQKQSSSRLACLRASDGSVAWSVDDFGHASMVAADGVLWLLREDGELVAATVDPESFQEIGRRRVFDDPGFCWTPPSVAGGRLYLRSQKGELVSLGRPPGK